MVLAEFAVPSTSSQPNLRIYMTSTSIYDCITEQVIANFKPTRLYIKRHSITGVLYLGKTVTTGKKFESYYGGGIVWARHLKVHGTCRYSAGVS